MALETWEEAVKALETATGPATQKQRELGKIANTAIEATTPRIVAAAMLRYSLAEELNLPTPYPAGDWVERRLQVVRKSSVLRVSPQSKEEADALYYYDRLIQRKQSLSKLKINKGDIVRTADGDIAEVSSIGQDGRVFFRGGRGFGSWPDLISIVARKDEVSTEADKARCQADNTASRHKERGMWSMARANDLTEFLIEGTVSKFDIDQLEAIISSARDERPIQKFLQQKAFLLAALLGGRERYCLTQKRLGSEYVPDFIIGDVDSLGIRWVLIELESPRSKIYLDDGSDLDKVTRKGFSQVVTWRNWLSDNIAYARQRRSENGLGLFDIREKAEAFVLVGRRSLMPQTKDAQRRQYRQENNIHIHSYDWLLDRLHSIAEFSGPPSSNPHLIQRQSSSADLYVE